jgi:hypothetical protein
MIERKNRYGLFTPKMYDKIDKWAYAHKCTIKNEGATGGKITYHITPTSLGPILRVSCDCGSKMDLTDYKKRNLISNNKGVT